MCCGDNICNRAAFPKLNPIPAELLPLYISDITHIGRMSSYYNNILAISATGVDHGPNGAKGWEKIVGDHAVKLHGKTYHYLPPTGGTGGISYFTFDAMNAAILHGQSINGDYYHVNDTYVTTLFQFLQQRNSLVQECVMIGSNVRELGVNVNEITSIFDIAAVTSVHASGDRILR
jgi:hypothetical protein